MSIVELALTEGPLAAAYLLAMGALAFGIVPVTPVRLRVARNCFLASCAIFAGIALLWGITTDYATWPRILIVGALAAIAGIGAVESSRFIMHGQNIKHDEEKSGPANPPAIGAAAATTANPPPLIRFGNVVGGEVKGNKMVGGPPRTLLDVERGIDIHVENNQAIEKLPDPQVSPTLELRGKTNQDLKKHVSDFCAGLRVLERQF
jgi:hypothetical protein